jgi:ribosomal protein L15
MAVGAIIFPHKRSNWDPVKEARGRNVRELRGKAGHGASGHTAGAGHPGASHPEKKFSHILAPNFFSYVPLLYILPVTAANCQQK